MVNAKHTPGPWANMNYGCEKTAIIDQRGTEIGFVHRKANAHLIAAAPELLHALLCLTEWVEDHSIKPNEIPELVSARAAIKKAEAA